MTVANTFSHLFENSYSYVQHCSVGKHWRICSTCGLKSTWYDEPVHPGVKAVLPIDHVTCPQCKEPHAQAVEYCTSCTIWRTTCGERKFPWRTGLALMRSLELPIINITCPYCTPTLLPQQPENPPTQESHL